MSCESLKWLKVVRIAWRANLISASLLARVLVLRNKPDPEYHAFFAAWKSADADLPLPVQSHAPLQRAESRGVSHRRVDGMVGAGVAAGYAGFIAEATRCIA